MRQDPEVLIIGGGIAGLFCAYHLRRAGRGVAVVERGPVGGPLSCSAGNTGFVGTQGAAPLAVPGVLRQIRITPHSSPQMQSWLRHFRRAANDGDRAAGCHTLLGLKQRSLEILREVCASGPLAATFTAPGIVLAYRTAEAFEQACGSVAQAVAHGVPLRVLDPDELRVLEPSAEFDIRGALCNDEGAFLRVPDFVVEFARMLAGMGVEVHERAEVAGFEVADRVVRRVLTTRGDFRPGEVVLAAGARSAGCARQLGVGLMLQPVKGYSVTVATPPGAPSHPVVLGEGRIAVAPLGDRLRFAGALELSGFDGTISRRRVDAILHTVRAYLPRLEPTEIVESWAGFRPCTPDSLPFLGRVEPYHNLTICCGHGHIGMGLAPAGGELVAQIISGEQPDADIAPFRVDRYGRRVPT